MMQKKNDNLKGMGPAFFTKVIYFLTPRDKSERQTAYIMDQWAASSVNLLVGWNMVRMDVTRKSPCRTRKSSMSQMALSLACTVSDNNTAVNYEAFCSAVDQLHVDSASVRIRSIRRSSGLMWSGRGAGGGM